MERKTVRDARAGRPARPTRRKPAQNAERASPEESIELFSSAVRKSRKLVDLASDHMLVSKIKPCTSQYK